MHYRRFLAVDSIVDSRLKMLCKVSYRHGPKKAVVAENLKSLIDKGRHIFIDIVRT